MPFDVELPDGRIITDVPDGTTQQELADKLGGFGALGVEEPVQAASDAAVREGAEELSGFERFAVGAGRELTSLGRGASQLAAGAAEEALRFIDRQGTLPSGFRGVPAKLAQFQKDLVAKEKNERELFQQLDDLPGIDAGAVTTPFGPEDIGQLAADAATFMVGGGTRKGLVAAGSILGGLRPVEQGEGEAVDRAVNVLTGGLVGLFAGMGGKVVGGVRKPDLDKIASQLGNIGATQAQVKTVENVLKVGKAMPLVRMLAVDRVLASLLSKLSRRQVNQIGKALDAAKTPTAKQEAVARFISPLLGGTGLDAEGEL